MGKYLAAVAVGAVGLVSSAAVALAAVGFAADPDVPGGVNGASWAAVVVGDELWVGGDFAAATNAQGVDEQRRGVAVFDVNTGELADSTADVNGNVRALETDGETVWIGGSFGTVGGIGREGLAQWDPLSRSLMPAFDASITGEVLAMRLHRGWLYVGGNFSVGNRRNLVRVDPTSGVVDNGFRPDPNARVVDIDAHGDAIYVAGSFTQIGPSGNREGERSAAAIDWVTGIERGVEIGLSSDPAQAIAVSADGTRVYIGDDSNEVYSYTSAGRRIWARGGQGNIQAIVTVGDRVYVGLHDGWDRDGDDRMLVALRTSDGSNDRDFDIEMKGFWGVRGLAASDQGLIAVGEFTEIRGISTNLVAIFRPLGGYTPAEPLAALGDVDHSGQVNGTDVQMVLDFNVGKFTPGFFARSADVNRDGVVDLLDALLIAQQSASG